MERGEKTTRSNISFEIILSTTTGILYGFGIAIIILFVVLMSTDQETISSVSNILFGI